MRARHLALGLVLLAGCGGGDDKKAPASANAADIARARAVAQAYLEAVAARNYKAACGTRSAPEVEQLAATGGSCKHVFATLLKKQPVDHFRTAKAGAVRIRGDVAGIDVTQRGQKRKLMTLAAVREGDGWKLEDKPDAETP